MVKCIRPASIQSRSVVCPSQRHALEARRRKHQSTEIASKLSHCQCAAVGLEKAHARTAFAVTVTVTPWHWQPEAHCGTGRAWARSTTPVGSRTSWPYSSLRFPPNPFLDCRRADAPSPTGTVTPGANYRVTVAPGPAPAHRGTGTCSLQLRVPPLPPLGIPVASLALTTFLVG
jgi:hypothetical protein